MINISNLRIGILIALFTLASGCKLHVLMVEGGEVQSIGSGTCLSGTVCIHQVSDTNYSESFTAVPLPGWHFVKWNDGDAFICGSSTNPVCNVSNIALAGNPAAEAVVDSNQAFYILPVFAENAP